MRAGGLANIGQSGAFKQQRNGDDHTCDDHVGDFDALLRRLLAGVGKEQRAADHRPDKLSEAVKGLRQIKAPLRPAGVAEHRGIGIRGGFKAAQPGGQHEQREEKDREVIDHCRRHEQQRAKGVER